jgi:hypothetical protein
MERQTAWLKHDNFVVPFVTYQATCSDAMVARAGYSLPFVLSHAGRQLEIFSPSSGNP